MVEPIVLDGGLGTELERQGYNLSNSPLWSASLLLQNPEAIYNAHLSFFQAGADVATTASYQASVPGFVAAGYSVREALDLISESAQLASSASDSYQKNLRTSSFADGDEMYEIYLSRVRPRYVLGSCGPYGAYLADRSEYTGNYHESEELIKNFHRPRLMALKRSHCVDYYLFETFPSLKEAKIVLSLLREFPELTGRVWFSFSCRSNHEIGNGANFRDSVGELLLVSEATAQLHALLDFDSDKFIDGIGVNCCNIEFIPDLLCSPPIKAVLEETTLKKTRNLDRLRIITYPNIDSTSAAAYPQGQIAQDAQGWVRCGVTAIGGCCGTSPQEIASIRLAFLKPRQPPDYA